MKIKNLVIGASAIEIVPSRSFEALASVAAYNKLVQSHRQNVRRDVMGKLVKAAPQVSLGSFIRKAS